MQTFAAGDNEIKLILGADETVARDSLEFRRISTECRGVLQAQDLSVLSAYLLVCGARLETLTVYPRQVPGSDVLDDYTTKLIFHQFPVKPSIICTMQRYASWYHKYQTEKGAGCRGSNGPDRSVNREARPVLDRSS